MANNSLNVVDKQLLQPSFIRGDFVRKLSEMDFIKRVRTLHFHLSWNSIDAHKSRAYEQDRLYSIRLHLSNNSKQFPLLQSSMLRNNCAIDKKIGRPVRQMHNMFPIQIRKSCLDTTLHFRCGDIVGQKGSKEGVGFYACFCG